MKELRTTPPRKQWQRVFRRQTSNHRTGECIEDLHHSARKKVCIPFDRTNDGHLLSFLPSCVSDTKALARMGVVSSSSSDPDETDQPPASRTDYRENPERDDQSYRRVFLNEAQTAPGSYMVPKFESKMLGKSASELSSFFDQVKKRSDNFCEIGFRVYVKKQSSHSWIKPLTWNHNCVNTTFERVGENDWYMAEDSVKLDKYENFDGGCSP